MSEARANETMMVGVEVGASIFQSAAVAVDGTITQTTRRDFNANAEMLPQLIDFIRELNSGAAASKSIGVAIPGLIHRDTKRIAFSAQFPEHSDIDLAGEIQSALGLEAVIENDANAAAYGELMLGAGRGCENLFFVTLGSGVGGALIMSREIWRGDSGFAGEFGYFAINSDGMRLEEVASAANIVRRTRDRFHQDSTSSLNDLAEDAITISEIVAAAEADDDFSKLMLERTGTYVGTAIASVINLLNIEKIIIGGGTVDRRGILLNALIRRARELAFAPSFRKTEIIVGGLGEFSAAVGAAILASE